MLSRARDVLLHKRYTGGPAARARAFWHKVIRRYDYEICGECGRPVGLVWEAPDRLWLAVMGGHGGTLCIPCFDRALLCRGESYRWTLEPER